MQPTLDSIETKDVTKVYRLYRRPVDRLKEALLHRRLHETFESLKGVTFSVGFGESVGIVGENGAGKSTLLKILSGILTPTSGKVVVHGRVAALLELGTGFHPEFTGRQNIYLNAALLGLDQEQIRDREFAIIDFAELGPFIDHPIKTYSSGMAMRLAFSIATSVDPDILVIDEALSVGDHYFQQKCIDRMLSFRERGKTILFCSHNTYAVNLLCGRAIWLNRGTIRQDGVATHVTSAYEAYLRAKTETTGTDPAPDPGETGNKPVLIRRLILNGDPGSITLSYRNDLHIELEVESFDDRPFWVAMGIRRNGERFWHVVNMSHDHLEPMQGKGIGRLRLSYPSLPLLHGQYSVVGFVLDQSGLHCHHRMESAPFTIIPPDEWTDEMGVLALDHEWKILKAPSAP
jgi:lipopolysaccharide transport system ATP-binding protein